MKAYWCMFSWGLCDGILFAVKAKSVEHAAQRAFNGRAPGGRTPSRVAVYEQASDSEPVFAWYPSSDKSYRLRMVSSASEKKTGSMTKSIDKGNGF